jgi:hypothetical protein
MTNLKFNQVLSFIFSILSLFLSELAKDYNLIASLGLLILGIVFALGFLIFSIVRFISGRGAK